MKINELLGEFSIFMSNEEKEIYDKISEDYVPLASYSEREQTHINNLIRKSIIKRAKQGTEFVIKKNERY